MRTLLSLCACIAVCFLLGISSVAAHADSFQIFNLGGDDVSLLGINAAGTALLHQFTGCNGVNDPNYCYEEFSNGSLVYRADAAPTNFVAQNGTPCASPAALTASGRSVCDGGFQVAGGYLGNQQGVWESFPGSSQPGSYVYNGSDDVLFVNAAGDFLVANGSADTVYQVMVSQTPEPSSLLLLATGALALGGVVRRRHMTR